MTTRPMERGRWAMVGVVGYTGGLGLAHWFDGLPCRVDFAVSATLFAFLVFWMVLEYVVYGRREWNAGRRDFYRRFAGPAARRQ